MKKIELGLLSAGLLIGAYAVTRPKSTEVRGANVRASWIMPSGANYSKNWWDIAKDVGINTFRLTLDVEGPFTASKLRDYLDIAETYNIKTIVLIPATGYPSNELASQQFLLPWLQAFQGDSRIAMWDIKNEPDVSNTTEITWLTDMSQWFHVNDPTHPITIGGWHNSTKPGGGWQDAVGHCEDGIILVPLVDIYSPHFYHFDLSTLAQKASTNLPLHKKYANGKPVILQEYGYYTIDQGSETNQQVFYQVMIDDTRSMGYRGSCFWVFMPPYPYTTDTIPLSPIYQDGTYALATNYLKSIWK